MTAPEGRVPAGPSCFLPTAAILADSRLAPTVAAQEMPGRKLRLVVFLANATAPVAAAEAVSYSSLARLHRAVFQVAATVTPTQCKTLTAPLPVSPAL